MESYARQQALTGLLGDGPAPFVQLYALFVGCNPLLE